MLLLFFVGSTDSIGTNDALNEPATYEDSQQSVNDSNEQAQIHNFTRTDEMKLSTTMPPTSTQMLNKPINVRQSNDGGQQKLTTVSSRDDNDYRTMKRAFDTLNEKVELFMTFYVNELSFVTTKMNNMKEKLNTLDILQHEMDQVIRHQNTAEQKLHAIQESIFGSQSIGSKLDRLEFSMQQLHVRVDELIKQKKIPPSNEQVKRKNEQDDPLTSSDEQLTSCESKIEQLVAFVHSFAELNRLESTDILNRLTNMQSQLIQFFDTKETIAPNQINHHRVNDTHTNERDSIANEQVTLLDGQNYTNLLKYETEANLNSTDCVLSESIEKLTTEMNLSDDRKLNTLNSTSVRKRKRTINAVG